MQNRRSFPFSLVLTTLVFVGVFVFHAFPQISDPVLEYFGRIDNLAAEDDSAGVQIAELEARIDALEEENAFFRRDRSISGDAAYPKLLARVLYYDPDPARSGFRIALPEGHSVVAGAPVVAPGNILIGTIERVGARSADVLLIDDPMSRIAARVGVTDGLLLGASDGEMLMQFVPATSVPSAGDAIVTSANEGAMPEGLVAGVVESVVSDPGNPFVDIEALPAVPLRNLTTVAVLLGNELLL